MQLLLLILTSNLVASFEPLTKEEQVERWNKVSEEAEPFRKNLTECAKQTKATQGEVERFLKRIPQTTNPGKCFVACILRKNSIIVKNKISEENLLEANRAVYGDDSQVMDQLRSSIKDCTKAVSGGFDICDYASTFNDCMHVRMEHIIDKVTMERRMEALGQMSSAPEEDDWADDEMMQMMKDEL